jgi:hypothetical protein
MAKRMLALSALFLTGCTLWGKSGIEQENDSDLRVSGPLSAVLTLHALGESSAAGAVPRPSAPLGLFVSAYLAQGVFLPVRSAAEGIEVQRRILAGQSGAATDESFTLLQELGNVLQVDVSDMLNRSPDRRKALDEYLQALRNVYALSERKRDELSVTLEALQEKEREQRKLVSTIERDIRHALSSKDFTTAGGRQKELSDAQGALAETAVNQDQTADIGRSFKDLITIAGERLVAIEANRAILIAGLRVVELPGIEDLNILRDRKSRRRSKESQDALGSDHLR